jgi:predicted alpha/beta-hydrolase family hydrolase
VSEAGVRIEETRLRAGERGAVAAIIVRPARPTHLLVLAHGAGAGMHHPFMEGIAARLAAEGIGTLRYQFPYTEAGRRRPDPPAVLQETVRAAVEAAGHEELPLLAGGKSMGGRMTSLAAAAQPLPGVRGLVFLGFPLHQARVASASRGAHLPRVGVPMLFVQGSRDTMADLGTLAPLLRGLDAATLRVIEDADHGFHVPKRTGRGDEDVLAEMAAAVATWSAALPVRDTRPGGPRPSGGPSARR